MIELPKEIVWDYEVPPQDELWRVRRLADFFPHFGRERASVRGLMRHLPDLRVPPEVAELIRLYAEYYDSHE